MGKNKTIVGDLSVTGSVINKEKNFVNLNYNLEGADGDRRYMVFHDDVRVLVTPNDYRDGKKVFPSTAYNRSFYGSKKGNIDTGETISAGDVPPEEILWVIFPNMEPNNGVTTYFANYNKGVNVYSLADYRIDYYPPRSRNSWGNWNPNTIFKCAGVRIEGQQGHRFDAWAAMVPKIFFGSKCAMKKRIWFSLDNEYYSFSTRFALKFVRNYETHVDQNGHSFWTGEMANEWLEVVLVVEETNAKTNNYDGKFYYWFDVYSILKPHKFK